MRTFPGEPSYEDGLADDGSGLPKIVEQVFSDVAYFTSKGLCILDPLPDLD